MADQAQHVVRQHRQRQHRIVGIELPARQALDAHVALQLRMELLVRPVIGIELDDLDVRAIGQAGPPPFDLDLGYQQALPMAVDRLLDKPHDPDLVAERLPPHRRALARPLLGPVAELVANQPGVILGGIVTARIPLDDPVHLPQRLVLLAQGVDEARAVEASIQPHRIGTDLELN